MSQKDELDRPEQGFPGSPGDDQDDCSLSQKADRLGGFAKQMLKHGKLLKRSMKLRFSEIM
jgi:hypothetical protein